MMATGPGAAIPNATSGLRKPTRRTVSRCCQLRPEQGTADARLRAVTRYAQVSFDILIDGNLDEKSLFLAAIDTATCRATAR